jgi:hypothetical protein
MPFHRNKLYLFLSVACLTGYIWLYFTSSVASGSTAPFTTDVCIIKHTTNIPCPSCGSTRSALALLQGNFIESLYWNPIGILLLLILLATPAWIAYDLYTKKSSLHTFYFKLESYLRKKSIAIPALILVIGNWCWNIFKGL